MAFTLIAAFFLLAGLCGMLGTVGWILRRGNNNLMTRLFIICQISIALWLVSQLLILFSESRTQLIISYFIGNAGICTFAPLWLEFSAEYSEASSRLKKFSRSMPIVSAVMFGCIAANPLHHMYYSSFEKGNITYGVLFYIFQFIFYAFIISGMSIMFVRQSRRSNIASSQSMLLALAVSVPLIVNLFTVSGMIRSKIELTPLFFAFSVIMVLIAIRRFGLLNINRIAINDTINNISTAVLIFDADNKMTYKNKCSEAFLPVEDTPEFDTFLERISEISDSEVSGDIDSADIIIEGKTYNFRCNQYCTRKKAGIAKIILINDVSEYYELAEAEKRLSIEQERNRIAQEIHDSAGHTFTMISSISKILQADIKSEAPDKQKIFEYAGEIDGLSRSGVTQLRCSINDLRDDEFMTSVTRAVNTVISAVRNIETELCIQGNEDESFNFCIREIYDSVRETLTNAMRYSAAEKIDIILKFLDDRLELYIFDNGCGCEKIKENNGLSGIRQRISDLGGTVRFSSISGEGFTTIIKIPKGEYKNDKCSDR